MVVSLRDRYSDCLPAGNRWHIDCFRCNTCGTILDSDANLLLLGDGSLICNNCTYSCSVCGNKIEDLAILTGDQAFCASCFKCRNCKKKIENLKYARTSQGIFCMECHESLMQRRRKKNHKNGVHNRHKQLQQAAAGGNMMLLDKSLPSLPPSADHRRVTSPEEDSAPSEYTETPTELPSAQRKRPSDSRSRSEQGPPVTDVPRAAPKRPPNPRSQSSRSDKREPSPSNQDEDRKGRQNILEISPCHDLKLTTSEDLIPPNSITDRHSAYSQGSDQSGAGNEFIPMVLDNSNPAPGPPPIARRDNLQREAASPPQPEHKPTSRDYFNAKNNIPRKPVRDFEDSPQIQQYQDSPNTSRHSSQPNSPHIAYQERGRQLSNEWAENGRRRKEHVANNSINAIANESHREIVAHEARVKRNGSQQDDKFTLQEVPKNKKAERKASKDETQSPSLDTQIPPSKSRSAPSSANTQVREQQVTIPAEDSPASSQSDATLSGSPSDRAGSRKFSSDSPPSHSSPLTTQLTVVPERGDSLAKGVPGKPAISRRELDAGITGRMPNAVGSLENNFEKPASAPPTTTTQPPPPPLPQSGVNRNFPRSQDSPSANNFADIPPPPLRAKERLALQTASSDDSFQTPRPPPQPPTTVHRARNDSINAPKSETTRNGEQPPTPGFLRNTERSDSLIDEELARSSGHEGSVEGNFLRRVSQSMRHARSYSDRGIRHSRDQKWPKSPKMDSQSPSFGHEIGSPISSSPEAREEMMWYRTELRRERQKGVEREQRLLELEAALEAKSSIKQMNSELREKRSTMIVLDTQKEIVVRELEVLTEHIATAKKSSDALDIGKMSNAVLREFAESLQQLKESFAPQIEDLTQQRNDLIEELNNLTQLKDKSFQEFEQLSLKNAQLADLNNQLVHQIQELYKANAGPGLDSVRPPPTGLGIYTNKDRPNLALMDQQRPSMTESSLTGTTAVPDQDAESAAYLSQPQVVNIRKAQPKKFNWKKGGHNMAKGVTKGIKGAFSSDPNRGQREGGQFTEGIPYGAMSQQEYPTTHQPPRNQAQDRREGFGGLFGDRKQRPQQWKNSPNGSSPAVHAENGPRTYARVFDDNGANESAALFGSELEIRADYERAQVPGIVMRCIQEVEARGNACSMVHT